MKDESATSTRPSTPSSVARRPDLQRRCVDEEEGQEGGEEEQEQAAAAAAEVAAAAQGGRARCMGAHASQHLHLPPRLRQHLRRRPARSGDERGASWSSVIAPEEKKRRAAAANMNKGLLRSSSGNSYPYPRTHTTMMVVPSARPFAPDDVDGSGNGNTRMPRPRPPLNRAIPPIPESKSNESIMTQASAVVEALPDPSPSSTGPITVPDNDRSVVIENRMAETITATKIPQLSRGSAQRSSATMSQAPPTTTSTVSRRQDPPRSPLMSVAHSVRSKLSKIGSRLTRHDSPSASRIRGSHSLSSMRPEKKVEPRKTIDQNDNYRILKSTSMETPRKSDSNDSIKNGMTRIPPPPPPHNQGKEIAKPTSPPPPPPVHSSPIVEIREVVREVIVEMREMPSSSMADIPEDPSGDYDQPIVCLEETEEREETIVVTMKMPELLEDEQLPVAEEEEVPMDTHMTPTEESPEVEEVCIRKIESSSPDDHERPDESKVAFLPHRVTVPVFNSPQRAPTTVYESPKLTRATPPLKLESPHPRRVSPPVLHIPAPPTTQPPPLVAAAVVTDTIKSPTTTAIPKPKDYKKLDKPMKTKEKEAKEKEVKEKEKPTPTKKEEKPKKESKKEAKQVEKLAKKEEKALKSPKTPKPTRISRIPFLSRRSLDSPKPPSSAPETFRPLKTSTPKTALDLPKYKFQQHLRAPLAECESSIIANSPAVELPPVEFEKWNNSPGAKRRSELQRSSTMSPPTSSGEARPPWSDGNGNVTTWTDESMPNSDSNRFSDIYEISSKSPLTSGEHVRGHLIDDEIRDQPQLMGDTFSTSESIERMASLTRKRDTFEPENLTLPSIDRSLSEDFKEESTRSRYQDAPSTSKPMSVYATNSYIVDEVDRGLDEVTAIRAQLAALQAIVQSELLPVSNGEAGAGGPEEGPAVQNTPQSRSLASIAELMKENDALRRQLHEKDQIINSLRQQVTQK